MDERRNGRRTFLKQAAATTAVSITSIGIAQAGQLLSPRSAYFSGKKTPLTPAEFKSRLEGPIQSNPAPFNARFEVDYEAVRKMIKRALHYGVRVFALTAGNTQYQSLTYDEIQELTRVVAESVDGRGLVIAATGDWWTQRAVDYARYAESVGADAVQVLRPGRSGGEDSLVKHFETIARSTRLGLVLHGDYSDSLFEKLLAIDSVVAMKEDGALTQYIQRQISFGDRIKIFGGGQEYRYLVGYPYGATAFYSTYTTFAPDISMRFWNAIKGGDLKAAVQITTRYDYPYLKMFTHPMWHATLEYFRLGQRYLRPPQLSYTDQQMKELKTFFDNQGLDPSSYE
jgi:dihydrodipicolinate synthase/N-acetylneuraminate lyase